MRFANVLLLFFASVSHVHGQSPYNVTLEGVAQDGWTVRWEMSPCDAPGPIGIPVYCGNLRYSPPTDLDVPMLEDFIYLATAFDADYCGSEYVREYVGPDPIGSCYAFFEFQEDIPSSPAAYDGTGFTLFTPQNNGSFFWVYMLGSVGLRYTHLYPLPFDVASSPKPVTNHQPSSAPSIASAPLQEPLYLGADYTDVIFPPTLNGMWSGTALNSFPPWNPSSYLVELELNVTEGCSPCGWIHYPNDVYPEESLRAPVTYVVPINCVTELRGAQSTGRCWQFIEDFTAEGASGDVGPAQFWIAPFSGAEQVDGTFQFSALQFWYPVSSAVLFQEQY